MNKFFCDIFTEPNNETFCPLRLFSVVGLFMGLGLVLYDVVWLHNHFDFQAFGIGLGATTAGAGAALGMKKDTPT